MKALRVCFLRGWRGNNILCATDHSEIHTNYTHVDSQLDTPPPLMMSHIDDGDSVEVEPERDINQSTVRIKWSRIINYQVKYREYWAVIGCVTC